MIQAFQVGQHLGGDARRRNIGDAAEQHGRQRRPSEQPSGDQTGREVQHQINGARRYGLLQAVPQFLTRVLQPQQKEQEQHAHLRAHLNEAAANVQGNQAAVAECQPGEQVERDGREAHPDRQARKEGEAHRDGP